LKDKTIKKKLKELERLAYTDDLTQILNRRKITSLLRDTIDKITDNKPASLVMFDVDDFKKINDQFGHYRGDKVLQAIAGTISNFLDGRGYFARWGGEEFVIILNMFYREEAIKMAKRIREIVDKIYFEEAGRVTISIGVTDIKKDDTLDSVVIRADNAVYKAKYNGKNRVEVEK